MIYRDIFKDECADEIVVQDLKSQVLMLSEEPEEFQDRALISALHTVIAYYSVSGTYMEGAYDS
jgi:hypothetical protein